MTVENFETNLGAAILGMYAAIKICRRNGIEWQDLGDLIEPVAIVNEEKEKDGTDGEAKE